MRLLRALTISAALLAFALPIAHAQRSGSHGGGVAFHGASGFHSGSSSSSHFSTSPGFRYSGGPLGGRAAGAPAVQRPNFYAPARRIGTASVSRYRRSYGTRYGAEIRYAPLGGIYNGYGWVDPGYVIDDPANDVAEVQPPYPAPPANADTDSFQGTAAPAPYTAPRIAPAPPPNPEEPITLIFKDGRPPLHIRNYALTRTMLYVRDQHHQDIPVAQLDLVATQKANEDAGVDFQLPVSTN